MVALASLCKHTMGVAMASTRPEIWFRGVMVENMLLIRTNSELPYSQFLAAS